MRARTARCLAVGWAALLSVVIPPRPARAQTFTNVTVASGLEAIRATRAADWWVSGLHFIDLDRDGHLDVFMSSHGSYGALAALNDGTGKFSLVSAEYPTSEIHIAYDIDEDGHVDMSATFQDGGGKWWLNASQPGTVLFSGTSVERQTNTARIQVMLDVDRDGKVDWVRGTENGGVQVDLGDGTGKFAEAKLTLSALGNANPLAVDLDGDGDKDWVTVYGDYRYEPGQSHVYREDGTLNLVDVTTEAGLYVDKLAILGVGDFDQDGDTDLIAIENSSFPESIFLNDGTGHFTKLAGAVSGITAAKPNYPTWGLATVTDLDNDGIADIVIDGRNYLHVLHGLGGGKFEAMNDAWGIVDTAEASVDNGFAFGDIDGDGDLDLIGWREIWPDRYFNLYRNDLPANHWVRVRPVGHAGNRGAAGAKIRVYAAGTDQLLWYEEITTYCHQVQPGYGYALDETERHYGLGKRDKVDVTVLFYPSNKLVRQDGVPADSTVRILEDGEGQIVQPPPVRVADGGPAPGTEAGSIGAGGADGATGGGGSTASGPDGGEVGVDVAAGSVGGCSCRTAPRRSELGISVALLSGLAILLGRTRRSPASRPRRPGNTSVSGRPRVRRRWACRARRSERRSQGAGATRAAGPWSRGRTAAA